jgi:hypothetical protein
MDNNNITLGQTHEQLRSFSTRLRSIRNFISRLISFFSVTEQDLKDAGVFHH